MNEPPTPCSEQGRGDPAGPFSNRSFRAAGLVLLVFVIWQGLRFAALDVGSGVAGNLYELTTSIGFRALACVVVTALLYHGLQGVRISALELSRIGPRLDHLVAPAVLYLTVALSLPAWAAIWRPYLT